MYVFTFTILALFAIKDVFKINSSTNLKLFILAILLLIFHDGFRWGVGTDWEPYLNFFELKEWDFVHFDIGYILLNKFVRLFTDNYSVFLILHAIIVYSLISITIYKYSVYPFLSLFLFYALMITYLGMNREYIAFAISLFSYKYLFENKRFIFVLIILVASLFHSSVLLFLFAVFFNNEIKLKYMLWIFITFLIISISGIVNKLPLNLFYLLSENIGGKMSFYSTSYELDSNLLFTIFSLLKRSICLIIAAIYYDRLKNSDKNLKECEEAAFKTGINIAKVHKLNIAIGDCKAENFLLSNGKIYLTDLEQAEFNGDRAWDLAEMLFYPGHYLGTKKSIIFASSLIDGYLKEGDKEILASSMKLSYSRLLVPWTPLWIIKEVQKIVYEKIKK